MSGNPEKPVYVRRTYKEALRIIGQNKDVRLSKEILLRLRRAGLRLIPQMQIEA